jgi:potassium/hydrogen antiporter
VKTTLIPPFRSGPWAGSPDHAQDVDGVAIVERLVTRDDAPGALVRLANGTLAVLGDVLAVGRRGALRLFAQSRATATALDESDRAWWLTVRAAL